MIEEISRFDLDNEQILEAALNGHNLRLVKQDFSGRRRIVDFDLGLDVALDLTGLS